MKHPFNDPLLYDHAFYPKRLPFVSLAVFFGIAFSVVSFFFVRNIIADKPLDWTLAAYVVGFGLSFLPGVIFAWWYPKQLLVGVNEDGVFVRKYGMVYWDDIKDFEIDYLDSGKRKQKILWIILHNPDAFFERNNLGRLSRLFNCNKVAVAGESISIEIEKLLELLRGYHKQNR